MSSLVAEASLERAGAKSGEVSSQSCDSKLGNAVCFKMFYTWRRDVTRLSYWTSPNVSTLLYERREARAERRAP